ECRTPIGALLGIREHDFASRAFEYCFEQGTWLESREMRALLTSGLERMISRAGILVGDRARCLVKLAAALTREGVRIVEPIGGHAIYVLLDDTAFGTDPLRPRSLEGLLYSHSGVRARIAPSAWLTRQVMRLSWPLDAIDDQQVERISRA